MHVMLDFENVERLIIRPPTPPTQLPTTVVVNTNLLFMSHRHGATISANNFITIAAAAAVNSYRYVRAFTLAQSTTIDT